MAAERVTVQEDRALGEERLGQAVGHEHAAQGGVARRDALGERDDVGGVAVALRAVPVAQPAEGADHLVGHQQHPVAVADLAHPGEVAGRRHQRATGVLHRLQDHGGHRLGALHLDAQRDVVGAAQRARVELGAVDAAVAVRVLHLHGAGHQRLERRLDGGDAGDRERAHARAVVGEGAADHLVPRRLAHGGEVLAGQLPRRLHRLRARRGEEHPRERGVVGQVDQPLGQLHGRRVLVAPHGEVGERAGLVRGGLGQLRPTVADLHGEQPGQRVEVAPARGVVHVGALAAHDARHGRRQAGEVAPQRRAQRAPHENVCFDSRR